MLPVIAFFIFIICAYALIKKSLRKNTVDEVQDNMDQADKLKEKSKSDITRLKKEKEKELEEITSLSDKSENQQ